MNETKPIEFRFFLFNPLDEKKDEEYYNVNGKYGYFLGLIGLLGIAGLQILFFSGTFLRISLHILPKLTVISVLKAGFLGVTPFF